MPVTIDSAFGLQQMGESAKLYDMVEGGSILDSLFEPEPCYGGDVYRFDREDFELSMLPFVAGRTTPAIEVKGQDKQVEFISLATIRVSKTFYAADLFNERAPGEITDNAMAEIEKWRQQTRNRLVLTKRRLKAMALRGTVTVSPANFPDSKTTFTITRAVTGLTAAASFALAATEIVSNIVQGWRRTMLQAGGPIRKLAFNNSVTRHLLGNTEVKDFITKTQRGVDVFSTAQLGEMGGIKEWLEDESFYKPEGGSATPFIADDELFALSSDEVNRANLRLVEGYAAIPNHAIGVGGPALGATKAAKPGLCEFAVPLTGNVPGIEVVAEWSGMALAKIPTLVGYCSDVTP